MLTATARTKATGTSTRPEGRSEQEAGSAEPAVAQPGETVVDELEDVVRGILIRVRLEYFLLRFPQRVVLAVFSLINGFLSIAVMAVAALATNEPFVFPSLGPTAFLLFYRPTTAAASPRNTIIGHAIGATSGYLCLVIFGLAEKGPADLGMSWARVLAAALSLGLTSFFMVLLNASHPPAGATTLIISLGVIIQPVHIAVLMLAVVLLVVQAILTNKLAGIPYPLWNPTAKPTP